MATLAIAADLDTMLETETLVTYDGALGHIAVQLPAVATGGAGAAVDDGVAFEFRNDGDATLEILENGTGVRVFRMEPFSSLVLRSMADLSGNPRWHISDNLKEIIAVAEATTIADLAVTDVTTIDSAAAVSSADTYTAADIKTGFDAALNTVIDNYESEFATAAAQVETTLNLVLAALTGANITV